jgi:hypothetical protein
MKIFSLNMANGVSENPSFHTDKNVNLILVKSAPAKRQMENLAKFQGLPF